MGRLSPRRRGPADRSPILAGRGRLSALCREPPLAGGGRTWRANHPRLRRSGPRRGRTYRAAVVGEGALNENGNGMNAERASDLDSDLRRSLERLAVAHRVLAMEGHNDLTLGHMS